MEKEEFDCNAREMEKIAEAFHFVYQKEAERQGNKRHDDNYFKLPEPIKQFDRVLVLHVVEAFTSAWNELAKEKEEEESDDDRMDDDAIPCDEVWERFKLKLMQVPESQKKEKVK